MPKNKRPNRHPAAKKAGKRVGAGKPRGGKAPAAGKAADAPAAKAAPKTYGAPKSSRSTISPAMSRRSTRGR